MKRPKNTLRKLISSLDRTVFSWSVAIVVVACVFCMSFMAEGFGQEDNSYEATMLSYNRDFLVDGRWWFLAAGLIGAAIVFYSLRSRSQLVDELSKAYLR